MKYFKLPDLGEGLPEAEILEWQISEGDHVTTDQILVTVETAKAIIEIPSPQDGVISHLFGQSGDTIHTGEPLIEFAGEEDDSGTVVGVLKTDAGVTQEDNFFIGAAPSTIAHSQQMTPAVRALANRLEVTTEHLQGSGRNGQITPEDIERAARTDRTHGKAEPLRGVRKQMAKNMARAHAEVVPVTLCEDVEIQDWNTNEDVTMRLIHAIAAGCKAEPAMNAWFDGHQLARRLHSRINLGVAVDTEQGLFVPVIRDIGNRSLSDIRGGLDRMREDVINRTIPPAELQGGSITLSNFGTIAGRYATPVVVPPTVAILGAGVIRNQPVALENEVVIRRVLPLSLTFDHRAATGGEAARFIRAVIDDLSEKTIT
ncbi:dihydrolipoamide acetyltransferase family protein [Amphritea balenae]|uniref:Dihydrolipoamide acetyltransferase component of pyruvate dehydrogenase complex n=1 Tax=Amphritea balenae TaxID=452629 RepID=A0A3P1SNY2_9GAMM|nr:dihydrolipoamide acetyltransferase family protein [Amphritea balenae]RRC98365.1 2-oxo acid dehydrogenase subunit E2 [Amphritea balenae]GGK81308.1 dihydrolipoamide acetyltransferase component of pyruvate dehydrogenase complex [Amphritea balenae]